MLNAERKIFMLMISTYLEIFFKPKGMYYRSFTYSLKLLECTNTTHSSSNYFPDFSEKCLMCSLSQTVSSQVTIVMNAVIQRRFVYIEHVEHVYIEHFLTGYLISFRGWEKKTVQIMF